MALRANLQEHAEARKLSELRWLSKRMDKVRIFRHEMTEFSLISSPPAAYRGDAKKVE
jgi:hypothetical protein